ncbi:hypothetical protein [Microcoleus sp.]|uniref:hypothetical protein n=1 Tax=Microcoleus sp. TaxID=44472 RepID=UPI0035251775
MNLQTPKMSFCRSTAWTTKKPNPTVLQIVVVVLDEDIARILSKPEAVNKVLRALIEAMPQPSSGETV